MDIQIIVVILLVAVSAGFLIRKYTRAAKSGKSGCGCGCNSCSDQDKKR